MAFVASFVGAGVGCRSRMNGARSLGRCPMQRPVMCSSSPLADGGGAQSPNSDKDPQDIETNTNGGQAQNAPQPESEMSEEEVAKLKRMRKLMFSNRKVSLVSIF